MKVLKGILSESREFYLDARNKIEQRIRELAKGSIKRRKISGKEYYYLQQRIGKKVIHKYCGKNRPESLLKQIQERKVLKKEL